MWTAYDTFVSFFNTSVDSIGLSRFELSPHGKTTKPFKPTEATQWKAQNVKDAGIPELKEFEPMECTSEKCMAEKYRDELTPEQFDIAYNSGTERPFKNAYWNNHDEGIYVSVASGVPLFSSKNKYDSGTGWPSFSKTLKDAPVENIVDSSLWMTRTEVKCSLDHVHLGHVFNDGPKADGGMRYCMNSGAMKFIPKDELTKEQKLKYGF